MFFVWIIGNVTLAMVVFCRQLITKLMATACLIVFYFRVNFLLK